jgi:hypothetical protein
MGSHRLTLAEVRTQEGSLPFGFEGGSVVRASQAVAPWRTRSVFISEGRPAIYLGLKVLAGCCPGPVP